MRSLVLLALTGALACGPDGPPLSPVRSGVAGVLRPSPAGSFFSDGVHEVLLAGSHTWNSLQDLGFTSPPPVFDYSAYLDSLERWNHNFFRLYVWEQGSFSAGTDKPYWIAPLPYVRTGPGVGNDGLPKFDLTKFDPAYFARLRERVVAAGARGMYVSVMLFNGWSIEGKQLDLGNPWRGHPFNGANNINGVDADLDRDGEGKEAHTLADSTTVAFQDRYVLRVVATLRDLPNVLYEISNESPSGSVDWQYHMIRLIHDAERDLPQHHPVGITVEFRGGDNAVLLASPADWFSPNGDLERPEPFDGAQGKVVVWDTDHLCGICGSVSWVWKGFLMGFNPILMDGWDGKAVDIGLAPYDRNDPRWEPARRNLGYAVTLANRLGLERLAPRPDLASTGYCLADTTPGSARFLVYVPRDARLDLDLRGIPARDTLKVEWLDTRAGTTLPGGVVGGGARVYFDAPTGNEAILILQPR